MTHTQAKLIIWHPDAYPRQKVREAAIFILGKLNVSRDDIRQATLVL